MKMHNCIYHRNKRSPFSDCRLPRAVSHETVSHRKNRFVFSLLFDSAKGARAAVESGLNVPAFRQLPA